MHGLYGFMPRSILLTALLICLSGILCHVLSGIPCHAYSTVLITEFYPNTVLKGEPDEYIVLTNPCKHSVDLTNWSITDNEAVFALPHLILPPDGEVYLTNKDAVYARPDAEVVIMNTHGFALRNQGDEIILRDGHGRVVDVVIYGDSCYGVDGEGGTRYDDTGWHGRPLSKPIEGLVFHRKGYIDTDTETDWVILAPGASYHPPEPVHASNTAVTTFVSPDCSFSVLKRELDNATSSIYLNLYEFDNARLNEHLLRAMNRGVRVHLLLEARPVGGMTDAERCIVAQIEDNGGIVRFSHDRFLNHAKYAVIDDETLIIMSENWKYTGVPCNNGRGNRGWGIVIRNQQIAQYFKAVFFDDFRRAVSMDIGDDLCGNGYDCESVSVESRFEPRTMNRNFTLIPVLAPDSAMSEVLRLIKNARSHIYVEQFSAKLYWKEELNPFIKALIEAAQRGCDVKILLDSRYLEGDNNNDELVAEVNRIARAHNLSLTAKLADLDSLDLVKIHNKGLIVDGRAVFISSLNWNMNSIYNREVGVIIEEPEIASFYERVFLHDWNGSHDASRSVTGLETRILYIIATLVVVYLVFLVVKRYKHR